MNVIDTSLQELLNHPLCLSLIRRKWIQFGGVIYFLSLLLYSLFVASLTLYVITTPAPFSTYQLEYYAEKKGANASAAIRKFVESNVIIGSDDNEIMCLNLEANTEIKRSKAAFISQIGLLVVLALLLIKGAVDLVVVIKKIATLSGIRSFPRFCTMISESSTVVAQASKRNSRKIVYKTCETT